MRDHPEQDLPIMAFRPGLFKKSPATLEGSKGPSMPPPDPELIKAQIKSLGVQDKVMESIMRISDEFAPLQREQMEWGLETARKAYDQSQQDRDWMIGRRGKLAGLQDKLIEDANSYNAEDRREELAGQALADVNQVFGNAREQGMRSMTRMGVNPNDGRMAAFDQQHASNQALAMASAKNQARRESRQEGMAMTDRATNALAGYPAMGMQATGAGAGFGGMGLQLANAGLGGMTSGYGMAGNMAGQMGQNATGMYSAQGNMYLQDQQAGAAGMGALGSAVGGIAMAAI